MGKLMVMFDTRCKATYYVVSKLQSWFDPRVSFNPAIHRTKQALFHAAVVPDLATHPLPAPHPELTKYFEPPKQVLKKSRKVLEECMEVFKVKEGA